MGKKYVGTIILNINGVDVECKSFKPSHDLKRKAVPTMNRWRRSLGTTQGVPEYSLDLTAPVQPSGLEVDWDDIEDAVLSVYDRRAMLLEQYYGCFTMSRGTSYEMEGESVHDVKMGALDHFNAKSTLV